MILARCCSHDVSSLCAPRGRSAVLFAHCNSILGTARAERGALLTLKLTFGHRADAARGSSHAATPFWAPRGRGPALFSCFNSLLGTARARRGALLTLQLTFGHRANVSSFFIFYFSLTPQPSNIPLI